MPRNIAAAFHWQTLLPKVLRRGATSSRSLCRVPPVFLFPPRVSRSACTPQPGIDISAVITPPEHLPALFVAGGNDSPILDHGQHETKHGEHRKNDCAAHARHPQVEAINPMTASGPMTITASNAAWRMQVIICHPPRAATRPRSRRGCQATRTSRLALPRAIRCRA